MNNPTATFQKSLKDFLMNPNTEINTNNTKLLCSLSSYKDNRKEEIRCLAAKVIKMDQVDDGWNVTLDSPHVGIKTVFIDEDISSSIGLCPNDYILIETVKNKKLNSINATSGMFAIRSDVFEKTYSLINKNLN